MEKLSDRLVNYASVLEPKTASQAHTLSKMPFIFPHVALMPDAHLGMGATVGSVIPTRGAIMPSAVGVDIGCGMIAIKTEYFKQNLAGHDLKTLREGIESVIPLSPGNYNTSYWNDKTEARVEFLYKMARERKVDLGRSPDWMLQLGSLGGGNHFIEVSLDENDQVWLFLHSGSRGVGNKIAQHHIKVAKEFCRKSFIKLPDPDLAYLVEGTPEFWSYIREMLWAQTFAYLNREEMMERVINVFQSWLNVAQVTEVDRINCHHNYTMQERHFGKDVWLSRKGAIDAHEGVAGLIPGSMGTRSYVVRGKGNRVALCSSPHGAGRLFSRSAAKREFTQEDLRQRMEGIEYRDSASFVDEIPDAYKDIDTVMADSADLVEVKHELRQIVNVKGE